MSRIIRHFRENKNVTDEASLGLKLPPGVFSTATFPPPMSFFQRRKLRKNYGGISYELLNCAFQGHRLVGGDVRYVDESVAAVIRETDSTRWLRCLRCDAWIPIPLPMKEIKYEFLPPKEEISVPLRGKLLRDRWILRLIAVNKFIHCVLSGIFALLIGYYVQHKVELYDSLINLIGSLRTIFGDDPHIEPKKGIFKLLYEGLKASNMTIIFISVGMGLYACIAAIETIGLWLTQRWAEYVTLLATSIFLIPEVIELFLGVTIMKVVAFIINLAVIIYLLVAKRLFGVNGGVQAEEKERELDIGWGALDRVYP